MSHVSPNNSKNECPKQMNVSPKVLNDIKDKYSELKLCAKHVLPYALAATFFYGLSEQTYLQPSADVVWAASKILDGMCLTLMGMGCFNLFKVATNPNAFDARKVVFVATQQQIDLLNAEIEKLKSQLEQSNTSIKEHNIYYKCYEKKNLSINIGDLVALS